MTRKEKLSGVVVKEQFTGQTFTVDAKVVVNATGPVSDHIRQMATPSVGKRMRPSKGSHILLPLEVFPSKDALLVPKTEDGRVLFAVPWNDRLLVGTTDEEISPDAELLVTGADIEYILRQLNQYLARPVTPDDIVSGFAGARPLVASEGDVDTKKLARDDVIEVDPSSGLISIMGGKWTTHRAMAEDTIHRVQQSLGVTPRSPRPATTCSTAARDARTDYSAKLADQHGLSEATARHLTAKFGTAAERFSGSPAITTRC